VNAAAEFVAPVAPLHIAEVPEADELVTAPSSKRLFARLLDGLINLTGGAVGALIGGLIGALLVDLDFGGGIAAALCLVGGMFAIFFVQIYFISTTGQSLGKRIIGIRIVRTDGSAAGFVHGWLMRTCLVRVLDFFLLPTVVLGLAFWTVSICMLGTEYRQMLHDRIAGTRVVMA